jgi:hypothetical protein
MNDTDQKELETLRRMLATPPTPHKAKKDSSDGDTGRRRKKDQGARDEA